MEGTTSYGSPWYGQAADVAHGLRQEDHRAFDLGTAHRGSADAGGLSIAVDVGEGCAIEAMMNASVFVVGIQNALDRLLDHKRIVGTLRTKGDNANDA
jgi:hypothetical protein